MNRQSRLPFKSAHSKGIYSKINNVVYTKTIELLQGLIYFYYASRENKFLIQELNQKARYFPVTLSQFYSQSVQQKTKYSVTVLFKLS